MNLDQNTSVSFQFDSAYEVHFVLITQKTKVKQIKKHLSKIRDLFHELYQPDDLLHWSGDIRVFTVV